MIDFKHPLLFNLLVCTVLHVHNDVTGVQMIDAPPIRGTSHRYIHNNVEGDAYRFEIDSSQKVTQQVKVKVDTISAVHTVEESFISYALDFSLLNSYPHWPGLNFTSQKLLTLVHSLAPSIIRIGGSGASYSFFNAPQQAFDAAKLKPAPVLLDKDDVVKLVTFTRAVGARLLLDLNLQQRYGEQWDPSNAIQLMDFCTAQKYGENIDFELGNEPVEVATGSSTFICYFTV